MRHTWILPSLCAPSDGQAVGATAQHCCDSRLCLALGSGLRDAHVALEDHKYECDVDYYEIDSVEDAWNTARIEEPNLGYKPSFKGGYFPVSSTDTYHDLRGEMATRCERSGSWSRRTITRSPRPAGRKST